MNGNTILSWQNVSSRWPDSVTFHMALFKKYGNYSGKTHLTSGYVYNMTMKIIIMPLLSNLNVHHIFCKLFVDF